MRRLLAAFVVVVAACGDDGNVNPLDDAPLAPDSPDVDAPTTGVVTLTITLDGTPQEGRKVYFQNADSSLVSATMTDASGVASATMDIGGFVTAIDPFPLAGGVAPPTDLRTFAGVKPGDNLLLSAVTRGGGGGGATTNFTLLVPGDLAATSYLLKTNCDPFGQSLAPPAGSNEPAGGPISVTGCGATIDLVVETFDAIGDPVGTFSVTDQAITEGGTVDLQGNAYLAFTSTTWSFSAVPSNLDQVTVNGFLGTSRGPIVQLSTETTITAGSGTTAPLLHAPLPGAVQVNLSAFTGAGVLSIHRVLEWGVPNVMYMLPVGNAFLMPDVATAPAFDIPSRSVTWTVAGSTQQPDFAVGRLNFQREGNIFLAWDWEIAAPHGTAAGITLPVLPAPEDQLNPIVGDTTNVDALTTAQAPGGYDAVRASVLTVVNDPFAAVAGATGRVVLQEVGRGVIAVSEKRRITRRPSVHMRMR